MASQPPHRLNDRIWACHAVGTVRRAGGGTCHDGSDRQHRNARGQKRFRGVCGLVFGAVMLVGRGAVSRLVADLAEVGLGDRVLDVGCVAAGRRAWVRRSPVSILRR
jgi:hypothetical protein